MLFFRSRLLEQIKSFKLNNRTEVHPKSLEKYTLPLDHREVSSNVHQLLFGLTVCDLELLRSVHLQHYSPIKYISPSSHKRKEKNLKLQSSLLRVTNCQTPAPLG